MTHHTHSDLVATGSTAVIADLEGRGATFEVVEHEATWSAASEAAVVGWAREQVAKTVVLQIGPQYVLVIVPASERVDLRKVRDILGGDLHPRLATEAEIARDFPLLEVGATPPIGPALPMAELVDRRLLDHERILCAGGDARHSLVLHPRELIRLTDARVGDLCAEL